MTAFIGLSTHRYQVRLPGSLSTGKPREGFLLRVEWPSAGPEHPSKRGYADLMAWPELGDLTIDEELLALLRGTPTTLGRRAIDMARLDAEARAEERSLWNGIADPPLSHYLAGSVVDLPQVDFSSLSSRGFRAIKLKWPGTLEIERAREILEFQVAALEKHSLKLRLDFNGTMGLQNLVRFFSEASQGLAARIEFLEDPFPSEHPDWWKTFQAEFPSIALFADRVDEADTALLELADGWVIKPALQEAEAWIERGRGKHLTFTQYLGHALGSAWAAWHAARSPAASARDSGLIFESRIEGESSFMAQAISTTDCHFPSARLRQGHGIGWSEADFDSLTWSPWR